VQWLVASVENEDPSMVEVGERLGASRVSRGLGGGGVKDLLQERLGTTLAIWGARCGSVTCPFGVGLIVLNCSGGVTSDTG
jgi:hypothetical protein